MGRRPSFVPEPKRSHKGKYYVPSGDYLDVKIDPQLIGTVRSHVPTGSKRKLPFDRTEQEIDNLAEYNRMMGRV